MNESESNMSSDDIKNLSGGTTVKIKPKKRSLVERELETSLTARVTSPATIEGTSTSRYGRARRLKTDSDFCDTDKAVTNVLKSPSLEKTPVKTPPAYKMHAVNSPVANEALQKVVPQENNLENQIENIYNANISLSRFGSEEKKNNISPAKKFSKVYIRKDLIQTKEKEKEETITLIKNIFSPVKSMYKPANSHLNNVLERSSEKYNINSKSVKQNGFIDSSSVVKMLDFDGSKKKKENRDNKLFLSKSDLFELEAKCSHQVGDLAWARMGTFPFWPCIIMREPGSEMFVKKKLFGRIERDVIHVTFFGDNGRHSWVVDSMLRPFLGQLEFEATRDQFTTEAKKKDPRLYTAFFISDKKQALWISSVEEAEALLREPKRLRIDIFYNMLEKSRIAKLTPNQISKMVKSQKVGKITRTDSDVSLSESLFDTLFCEDDGKVDDVDRLRTKRNKSLDVSEVVTACLDNMAAKTGMTKIQKQSHMDRWLQKAKSKTPEKSQLQVTVAIEKVDEDKDVKGKEKDSKTEDPKKKQRVTRQGVQKSYSLRKTGNESQNLRSHHNEHDYSGKCVEDMDNCFKLDKVGAVPQKVEKGIKEPSDKPEHAICIIDKVETLCDKTSNKESGSAVANEKLNVNQIDEPKESSKYGNETSKSEIDINNVSCDQMEVDPSSLKDKDFITGKFKNCDGLDLGPSNNLKVTKHDCDLEATEVNKTDENVKATEDKDAMDVEKSIDDNTLINNTFNDFQESVTKTTENIALDNKGTLDAKEHQLKIKETDMFLYTKPAEIHDTYPADIDIPTDDDLTDCESDVTPVFNKDMDTSKILGVDENLIQNKTNNDVIENIEHADTTNDQKYLDSNEKVLVDENISSSECLSKDKIASKILGVDKNLIQNKINDDVIENKGHTESTSVQEDLEDNILSNDKALVEEKNASECLAKEKIYEDNLIRTEVEAKEKFDDKTVDMSVNQEQSSKNETSENIEQKQVYDVDKQMSSNKKGNAEGVTKNTCKDVHSEMASKENNVPVSSHIPSEPLKENNIDDDSESIRDEFDIETSSINSAISDISITENEMLSFTNGVPMPIMNGFHGDEVINKIKAELLQDSDTASLGSECDNITLNELKQRSRETISGNEVKDSKVVVSKSSNVPEKPKTPVVEPIESTLPKILKVVSTKPEDFDAIKGPEVVSSQIVRNKRSLRLRTSKFPAELMKENSFFESKDSSPERKIKEEEPDTISINSEDSNVSQSKRKGRKDKQVTNEKKEHKMQDPEFLRYLEFKQDALIDEHPELTVDEIVAYLYKTWLYEESLKCDIKKTDDIEQSNLVKGLDNSTQPKRVRKKPNDRNKMINIEKVLSMENKKLTDYIEVTPREKPKRKIIQPYYNEDYSDIEDEIEMFEIFKKKSKVELEVTKFADVTKSTEVGKSTEVTKPTETIKIETVTKTELVTKEETALEANDQGEISPEEYYNEEEIYFEQLTQPKPNVFKGLIREKVCEMCESTSSLMKCKGCSGMFHVDCVKKETEVVEVPTPVRGRKKKNKKRGRKPKVSTDSESQSDEKSQDPNISEEQNMSIDEPESHIVADAENFEAQLEAKMKELLETAENIHYDSYSSDDGLDWSDTETGKCKIVDIKLKPKRVDNTDYSDFKCKDCQKYDVPICFVCKSAVSPKDKIEHRQRCQVAHCHKYYHLQCLEQWPQTQFNSGEPSRNNKKINQHFEAVICPRHVCHTCVCDDPRGCKTRFSGDKLARCVRCPATYHSFTKCLPAGTQILTASHIICPRHYEHRPGKVPCHVNTGWCFICALGGSLICCEYCPTSFHAECLNIKPPEGGYMCEDCETGRLPLYGEMVWVKLGHYRWWPGIILHPAEIPENIMAVKHSLGEFVVRFFGQYDYYWVNRGRVFPFQEGDSGRVSGQKSKIDEAFTKAMEHAQRAFEILKSAEPNDEESLDIASSLLPPQYIKLKVNKPCGALSGRRVDVEESSLTQCECSPDEEEPCGPYSHCLNRMLLTECGPSCRAGDRCSNRAFEKRVYPKLVPYRTPHRGWGLKTLEDIKAGQFVIEYVGELIDEEEFRRRMTRKHEVRDENFYFLTLDKERMIDAGPKGNLARFMNHCCEPNCETQKWTVLGDVRVGLFALRDIPANNEVTFNYNLECAGIEKKRCLCGAKRCSGYIGAKPKQDEPQSKKPKITAKRPYKKRKNLDESPATPSTSKTKPKRPVGRPVKPRELTEIEKDLLIIKNATSGLSSDSEGSGRLSSIDVEAEKKDPKPLKRKRVSSSTEEVSIDRGNSPSVKVKRLKMDEGNLPSVKRVNDGRDSPIVKLLKLDNGRISPHVKGNDGRNSPNMKLPKVEDGKNVCNVSIVKELKGDDGTNSPNVNRLKVGEKTSEVGD